VIVVDASVLVTALGDDGPDGEIAQARLRDETLLAPHLIDLEVLSAWRRLVARGLLTEERAGQAIADLHDLRLTRAQHGPLITRCWSLRHNLSIYDAAYIALAEVTATTLLTADARLAAAPGIVGEVELLSLDRRSS